MKITTFNLSQQDLAEHSDQVKALVVDALVHDGLISNEDGERWCETHTVMMERRRWWMTLLRGKDDKTPDGMLRMLIIETPPGLLPLEPGE